MRGTIKSGAASFEALMNGRKPLEHFETPPQEVAPDQNAENDLHQLNDKFVFAHECSPGANEAGLT